MEMNPNPLYALDNNGALTLGSRISQSMPYDAESQLIRGTMSFSKDRLRELDLFEQKPLEEYLHTELCYGGESYAGGH